MSLKTCPKCNGSVFTIEDATPVWNIHCANHRCGAALDALSAIPEPTLSTSVQDLINLESMYAATLGKCNPPLIDWPYPNSRADGSFITGLKSTS